MKKYFFLMLFAALFLNACGPSPSNDLYSLEHDINEFKKNENYEKFWDTLLFLKEYKAELANEDFIITKRQDINNFLTVLGMNAAKCDSNMAAIASKAKNKKVKNHFYNCAALYQKAAIFWAEDWDKYLNGETKLPNIGQLIDELIKQKEYYDNEYLKLKSET